MRVTKNILGTGHGPLSGYSHLVIHETATPGAPAANLMRYWANNPDYMVHYVCDWNGAWQCINLDRLSWHVGNANGWTVGIEICHATNRADFERGWDIAVEFAAQFLKERGWGTGRMVSHDYCRRVWGGTDHTDPIGYFAEYGRTWNDFVAAVAKRMKGGTVNPQKPGKAVNDNGMYYRAHVANMGWLSSVRDGQVAGTTGNGYALEALKIKPPKGMELTVKAHIADEGWKTWTGIDGSENSGEGSSAHDPIIGTTGKSRRMEAIEIDVAKNPKKLRVSYRVHVAGYGWGPWIRAGYAAGTTGIGHAIEAIQIKAE